MVVISRWIRLWFSYCLFCAVLYCATQFRLVIYLFQQASGQLHVLRKTTSIEKFKSGSGLSASQRANLELIGAVKKYSVDSLGFLPTDNFTTVYDQHRQPVLWVITASEPYGFSPFLWRFPLVGTVSYKGFFRKELAEVEFNHLRSLGYDVDLRSVSAWSTLGWFSDPLMSGALNLPKGRLCNLLFHELFHATYYAPGSVDLNENLASFVAHQATIRFLRNEPEALSLYLDAEADDKIFSDFMLHSKRYLESYYFKIRDEPEKQNLKIKALLRLAAEIERLPFRNKARFSERKKEILRSGNAYFIDFQQYDSKQDSLQNVFNKIYRRDIKYLVSDLTLNKINS